MIKVLLFILSLTFNFIHAEGFLAGTLIKTNSGYIKIEDLKVSDSVLSYDFNNNQTILSKIVKIQKDQVDKFIQITLDNQVINLAYDQKIFIPELKWITAQELITKFNKDFEKFSKIEIIEKESEVYKISVEYPHNFFVTENNILAHNVLAIPLFFAGAVSSSAVKFCAVQAGKLIVTGVLILIGSKITENTYHRCNRHYHIDRDLPKSLRNNCYYKDKKNNKNREKKPQNKKPENKPKSNNNQQPGPNGRYQDAPYHHQNSKGVKSKAPANGQKALNNSVIIESKRGASTRRIAICDGEFVVLDQTSTGVYHGHVRTWSELDDDMQGTLIKHGWIANPKNGRLFNK